MPNCKLRYSPEIVPFVPGAEKNFRVPTNSDTVVAKSITGFVGAQRAIAVVPCDSISETDMRFGIASWIMFRITISV
jgi:hypothetical protein